MNTAVKSSTFCTLSQLTFPTGFLLFRHLRSNRTLLNSMKAYFSTCDLEDNEDDVKEVWNVGEACVARLGNEWYRAQVLEVNGSETAVVFVDLGNVRRIACRDLRIPREVIAMTWGVAWKGYLTKYPSLEMRKCVF